MMGDMAEPLAPFAAIDRGPKLYEVVSERMLAAIREAGFPPGSKLPSERQLGEQFGVSRTVIRESIKHLAAKGVLESRPGGGVVIAQPGHERVSESLELYLAQRDQLAPEAIREVREALEVAIVRAALRRGDTEALARVRDAAQLMAGSVAQVEVASRADVEFHRALAEASGNPLFVVLMESLRDVILGMRQTTLGDPGRAPAAAAEHLRIADALLAGDEPAAVAALVDHLEHSVEAYGSALGPERS